MKFLLILSLAFLAGCTSPYSTYKSVDEKTHLQRNCVEVTIGGNDGTLCKMFIPGGSAESCWRMAGEDSVQINCELFEEAWAK